MPKLYTRNQGATTRYYADLRDIGGGQVALKTAGSSRATSDESVALILLAAKIEELKGRVRPPGEHSLRSFVGRYLSQNPGQVTDQWLGDQEQRLTRPGDGPVAWRSRAAPDSRYGVLRH